MRWRSGSGRWRRRFALLPIDLGAETIWLEWYWARPAGEYTEVLVGPDHPWLRPGINAAASAAHAAPVPQPFREASNPLPPNHEGGR